MNTVRSIALNFKENQINDYSYLLIVLSEMNQLEQLYLDLDDLENIRLQNQ